MKAFVISLNGQPFVTAGVGDDRVLVTGISWVGGSPPRPAEGRLHFHVGGIDGRTGEHVRWSVPEIGVGDEITIKIIETNQVSPEDGRFRVDMDHLQTGKGGYRIVDVPPRPGMGRRRDMAQEPRSNGSGPDARAAVPQTLSASPYPSRSDHQRRRFPGRRSRTPLGHQATRWPRITKSRDFTRS